MSTEHDGLAEIPDWWYPDTSTNDISHASSNKRRGRPRGVTAATKRFRANLMDIIEESGPPLTGRQVYYIATTRNLGPKTKNFYEKALRNLGSMREDGELPWSWIADNTRLVRQPTMHGSTQEALEDAAKFYRRDYWRDQPKRVEIWVESDSIGSFINDTTDDYGVPLFACRGQASKTFLHAAADTAKAIGKPVHIIYVGDWDPSGLAIDRAVEERFGRYLDGAVPVELERIAVTPEQVPGLLQSAGPVKRGDSNYQRFIETCDEYGLPHVCVETEAIDPKVLRQQVQDAIVNNIDVAAWNRLTDYEALERDQLMQIANFAIEDRGEA